MGSQKTLSALQHARTERNKGKKAAGATQKGRKSLIPLHEETITEVLSDTEYVNSGNYEDIGSGEDDLVNDLNVLIAAGKAALAEKKVSGVAKGSKKVSKAADETGKYSIL